MFKKMMFCVGLLAFGATAFWYSPWKAKVAQKVSAEKEELPRRFVTEVAQRDINYTIEVSGDVAPEVQLEVKSEVGGKIKALYVEPGQKVKKGQLLCEIDDTDLRNEKASAETQMEGAQLSVDRAQLNYDRGKALFGRNLITQENFDNLESDLAMARNGLTRSQRSLQTVEDKIAKTKITAPTDGTLLNVNVIEGQVVISAASVNSGTTLMMVADLSRLLLQTHVNQVDVARLHPGQKVTLRMESLRESEMEGKVSFIAPVASTKNGVKGFTVEANILNPSDQLRPGMTIQMSIPVAYAADVVAVPLAAVFKGANDNRIVYVVRDAAPPVEREVTLGVSSLDYAEIKSGLKAGERILMVEPRKLGSKS